MSKEELLREFNSLPPEGQRLVSDFIATLQSRYKKFEREKRPKRTDITKENLLVCGMTVRI